MGFGRVLIDLRWPGLWLVTVGSVMLLTISLFIVFDALHERRDRAEVLAHGRDAEARVARATGIESVMIEWTDEAGKNAKAESRTGKPFARTSAGSTVPIKYDPASVLRPIILSQAQERERINSFWVQSGLQVIAGQILVFAAAAFMVMRAGRKRAGRLSMRALKLAPEQFSVAQFIAMISDEIEQLRAAGFSDEDIGGLVSESTGCTVSGPEIGEHYAPPEARDWAGGS